MKKIGIIIFAAALIIGVIVANFFTFGRASGDLVNFSFSFKGKKGSGNATTEVRDLREFTGVDVSGVFKVEITSQSDYNVEVEADDNLHEYIRTVVRNGKLHIETTRKISPRSPLKVRISMPNIENIDASGASHVNVTNINNGDVVVDSSGASRVSLSGTTAKLNLDVSGATKVDAEALAVTDATIDASGASHVKVNVTGNLNASASGASKVLYSGTPASIRKDASGASRIEQK